MSLNHRIINTDCLEWMNNTDEKFDAVFYDPPDNIKLGYSQYEDNLSPEEYMSKMGDWLLASMSLAPIVWVSFNARWTIPFGHTVHQILTGAGGEGWECKPCCQIFFFGEHNSHDLGNNHRPLWRIKRKDALVYPEQVRTKSWRQVHGDKRANPKGRVPGDVHPSDIDLLMSKLTPSDIFDIPRVTGNSAQRRSYHPTQLHEDLVERCIKLSTLEGQHVLDPFGGTGTTRRVCQKINRQSTLLEIDPFYCQKMAA